MTGTSKRINIVNEQIKYWINTPLCLSFTSWLLALLFIIIFKFYWDITDKWPCVRLRYVMCGHDMLIYNKMIALIVLANSSTTLQNYYFFPLVIFNIYIFSFLSYTLNFQLYNTVLWTVITICALFFIF